jgi:hypothetical protein
MAGIFSEARVENGGVTLGSADSHHCPILCHDVLILRNREQQGRVRTDISERLC